MVVKEYCQYTSFTRKEKNITKAINKMINRRGPRLEPWGTPERTRDLKAEEPLINTLLSKYLCSQKIR